MDHAQNLNQNQKASTHKHKASPTELLSSAKIVADAAKSTLRHDANSKMDKSKVADAAAGLLCAASHYGKLEEKSYGNYVEKAENYLHKYNASHSENHSSSTTNVNSSASAHSEGGFGEYAKMAEGFLKKH